MMWSPFQEWVGRVNGREKVKVRERGNQAKEVHLVHFDSLFLAKQYSSGGLSIWNYSMPLNPTSDAETAHG